MYCHILYFGDVNSLSVLCTEHLCWNSCLSQVRFLTFFWVVFFLFFGCFIFTYFAVFYTIYASCRPYVTPNNDRPQTKSSLWMCLYYNICNGFNGFGAKWLTGAAFLLHLWEISGFVLCWCFFSNPKHQFLYGKKFNWNKCLAKLKITHGLVSYYMD